LQNTIVNTFTANKLMTKLTTDHLYDTKTTYAVNITETYSVPPISTHSHGLLNRHRERKSYVCCRFYL